MSPSKTMNLEAQTIPASSTSFTDAHLTLKLLKALSKTTKKELSSVMKIEKDLLNETYHLYHSFDPNHPQIPALHLYTGLAFRSLELDDYTPTECAYLESHLRILSALYGVLSPMTGIWPYRLDFTHHFKTFNPAHLWKNKIPQIFKDEDLIFNLASEEFSLFLKPLEDKLHTIQFMELIHGKEKTVSANSKKARGRLAHLMIKHQIMTIETLRELDLDPYVLQRNRSNEHLSLYLKQTKSD